MRAQLLTAFAFVALAASHGALADPATCEIEPGVFAEPLVTTKDEAKDIYLAVARVRDPHHRYRRGKVLAVDEGSSWSVIEWTPPTFVADPAHPGRETVTVTAGGGTLELTIAKCNGAMTASFSR